MSTPLFSKQMLLQFDGSTSGECTDFSLSVDKDMIDIALMNAPSGAKQTVPDLYNWNLSFSGLVMTTLSVDVSLYGFDSLIDNMITDTDASIGVFIVPNVASNKYYGGTGYLNSMSLDGGVGSAVSFSGSIQGDGALKIKTTV